MRFFFIALFLLTPYRLLAQNGSEIDKLLELGSDYLYQNKDSAYFFFDEAYQLAVQQKDMEKSIDALLYTNLTCGYYYDLSKYKKTIDKLDSLLLFNKSNITDTLLLNEIKMGSLLYKIDYNFTIRQFDITRDYLKRMLTYLENISSEKLTKDDVENLYSAYAYAGAIYNIEEKYNIAEQYYKKSLRLYEKKKLGELKKLPVYNLLAALYTKKKEYKKSNAFLQKTIAIHLKDRNRYRNNIISSSILMAQNYIDLGQLDSVKYYLNISKSMMLEKDPFLSGYFEKLAQLYKKRNQPALALEMYNKSLSEQKEKWEGEKNAGIAKVFNKIGQLQESQNDVTGALDNYQKALSQLSAGFNSNNLKDNPSIKNSKSNGILFVTLKNKSGALNKVGDFLKSLSSVDQAIVTLDSLKPTFESEGDKQLLIENAFPLFEYGMEAAYQLYKSTDKKIYIDQAFFYSEKGKSVVLLEAISKTRANDFAKIPSEILEKEKQLRSLITYLEKRIRRKPSSDLEEQLFTARNEYRQLIKTIEAKYKKYYDLKYNTQMATVAMIQNYLKSDEALISYFYGDQAIYSIVISNDTKEFHKIALDDKLRIRIKTVHQMLENPKSDVVKLALLTNELYSDLLVPSLQDKKHKKLTIVTDGLLNYIPYGSLNTTKVGINYLIENYSISYASSATLLLQLKVKSKGNNRVLGFAPSFNNHTKAAISLPPLPNNRNELKQIISYFNGKSFTGNNASLKKFNTEVSNYGIIHLATHAVVNDNTPEYSYLAFSPENEEDYLLYVSDIYNLELNVNLVTLSACESGIGDLKRGEGMISLSRGFFYSGAASIVNTMWKINDASSSQLMSDFYKHLAGGQSKEVALQNAKLDFLRENKQNPLTHPYFWSGFVISGDTTPLVKKNPVWIWFIGALLVMAILGIFLFRRRKSKNLIQNFQ